MVPRDSWVLPPSPTPGAGERPHRGYGVDEACFRGLPEALDWDMDVLQTQPDVLQAFVVTVFNAFDLPKEFHIDAKTLDAFVSRVLTSYNNVPFHNSRHAVQVVHTVFKVLHVGQAKLRETLSPLDVFALLIAALCHDVDHRGTNNSFEINSRSNIALRYNDVSVLENHHCATCFQIITNEKGCNILSGLSRNEFVLLRKLVCTSILATDMSEHQKKLSQLEAHVEYPFSPNSLEDRQLLVSIILHAADLSNVTLALPLAMRWGELVHDEFKHQADIEQQLGLPVAPFMVDFNEAALCKNQVFFIDTFVEPLWHAVVCLLPELSSRLDNIHTTRESYEAQLKQLADDGPVDGVKFSTHDGTMRSYRNSGSTTSSTAQASPVPANMPVSEAKQMERMISNANRLSRVRPRSRTVAAPSTGAARDWTTT